MKKSSVILFCTLFAFVCISGDMGVAKSKLTTLKTMVSKDAKKKEEKKEKKAKAKKKAKKLAALAQQLYDLEQPDGLDSEAKPEKLSETALSEEKEESKVQGKTIDGRPVTYVTTTQKFKASAAFDQQILLNPGTDVIYPGSVLFGHTIASGTYKEITKGKKNDITVSYDLTNVKGDKGKTGVVTGKLLPSLSNYRKLHNQILGQNIGKASTTYSFEESTIYSESDFNIKFNFGVGFNSGVVETSVKTGFEFGKGTKKYKYMVKYMETFYTVDVDQGANTFLYQNFDVKDFQGFRPVYVASVAYGRLAYLTIESDETWDKIKADLDVAVDASMYGKYDAKIETSVNNLKKNNKINITVIGGSKIAISLDSFLEMLKTDSFSKDNPGKIVAYKLRFVDDNTVANTVYNDEYTLTKTTEQFGKGISTTFTLYKIKVNANDGAGKGMELYGNLELSDGVTSKSLWSYSRSAPHKVQEKSEFGWAGVQAFTSPNDSASFGIKLELKEKDGGNNADIFTNALGQATGNEAKSVMLNNLEDGKDIVIKSYATNKKGIISSEWVEFYIRVNKKYEY